MRPTKLIMSAFGPYADVTEIDFGALGASGVYLVCGDTGAGKTMIFDAICFALFGEASGDSKAGARSTYSLRSDYADAKAKTYVELSFEYRGAAYRVKRNPEYERAKDRGEGVTRQKADAELEFPDGRIVSGVRKVNIEVEELLGIDCGQFKQIVMLAQGEFRKLLTADTETREAIFRKLFSTERYERMQDLLAEESRKLERANANIKVEIASLAKTARLIEGSSEAVELEQRLREGGLVGAWLQGVLEKMIATDEPEHRRLEDEVEALRGKWHEANGLIKQAQARTALEVEKTQLEGEVKALSDASPMLESAFEEQKSHDDERNAAIERAAIVEGTFSKYEQMEQAAKELADLQARAAAAQTALESAQATNDSAVSAHATFAKEAVRLDGADVRLVESQATCDARKRALEDARTSLAAAKSLMERESIRASAAHALESAQSNYDGLASADAQAKIEVAQKQAVCESFSDAEATCIQAEAARNEAHRALSEAQRLRDQRSELVQARDRAKVPHAAKLEELKQAERVHDEDLSQLQMLQKSQRAGRAGLLAVDLVEGSPCPVCGSLHHPSPAKAGESIPSDDEIDAAASREASSQARAAALSVEAERLRTMLQQAQQALASFDDERGGLERIEMDIAEAAVEDARAEEALKTALVRKTQAETAAQDLKDAQTRAESAAKAVLTASNELQRAREAMLSAEAEVNVMRANLGEVDIARAQQTYDAAQKQHEEANAQLERAQNEARELVDVRSRLEAAQSACDNAQQALTLAKDAQQTVVNEVRLATDRVGRLRAELEFPSLDAARSQALKQRETARMLKEARDAAQQAVAQNESALNAKTELLRAKQKQIDEMPPVDVEVTQAAMENYTQEGKRLGALASMVKTRIDANTNCLAGLSSALAKAGDIEERYGRVKLLADAATGNLVGRAKVRFEAYIQAIYFDKVIAAANERLRMLTSGQFELVRYSDGSGNAKAGLGLYVIDSFTGRARDASSLSGGESFQASLCLALGLSDIVQAHAGGIEFDTMFVDEGFGSLDQGALGNAISLLSNLTGAAKLVGIISHVEDLKANIPKKLVVTKTRTGSSVVLES